MLVRVPTSNMGAAFFALAVLASIGGCAANRQETTARQFRPLPAQQVVVVAPVLNLSNTTDFDPLRVTDAVASELVNFPGLSAVPVNLTLAALAREGKTRVETPADAIELARQFGAQATLVTAVTEYKPYDPPIIGLIMQWYAVPFTPPPGSPQLATGPEPNASPNPTGLSGLQTATPTQVQKVFDAASDNVRDEVKSFAHHRDGHSSPYGWQRYIKSQELYVRYCCWSLIRSILAVDQAEWAASAASEAQQ